jgi:hypothetical protein
VPVPEETRLDAPDTRQQLLLAAISAIGPMLWFVVLLSVYALGNHGCAAHRPAALWIIAAADLASAVACALSWRKSHSPRGAATEPQTRSPDMRLLWWSSFALNAFSLLLLLAFVPPLLTPGLCG